MLASLPSTIDEFKKWTWSMLEPYFQELANRPIDASSVAAWLADWSRLQELCNETYNRLYVATTANTMDEEAVQLFRRYIDEINPAFQEAEQGLKKKLLASGLAPAGFEEPLRHMRAEVALFCEDNLPLISEELKLNLEYDKIIGDQAIEWEGEEMTLTQAQLIYQSPDRDTRARAWRLASQRQLQDREAINSLWGQFLGLRCQMAANAGFPDYRALRWQQLLRFDYTPADCARFHEAIENVVVPAAAGLYEKRRRQMGIETLRPWDLAVDPLGRPALKPYTAIQELEEKASSIFARVDPAFADCFTAMRREGLLDLENRKGKAPGGYCIDFPAVRRPFIFMNAIGLHEDVQTILHEGGHAFHVFEAKDLPYHHLLHYGMEIAEVASMSMELLAAPYLAEAEGGFYSPELAARARVEHLTQMILFWPYMAVVDAFQHWAYANPTAAAHPDRCDDQWAGLWDRFIVGVDWSGLETEQKTGWHRKLHIFQEPFYYVEYGLAQLGAAQVWANALQDQGQAVRQYRQALSLGGSRPLPELYAAAGARLAFDAATLQKAVTSMLTTIELLEAQQTC